MKYLNYDLKVKRQNNSHIVIEGLANAATVDRANELIDPKAWELDNFKKNPIVLFNHGHDPQFGYMPVGYAMDVRATEEGLYTKIKLSNSRTEKISAVRDLVEEGALKTFSVGFEPIDGMDKESHKLITKAQLIEISIVPIPMNQDSTFSLLSKAYNYAKTDTAKSWISSRLMSEHLAKQGKYLAAALYNRVPDKKRAEAVKKIAEQSKLDASVIERILDGDIEDAPQAAIDAFSKVLKIDKLFLETINKGEVVTLLPVDKKEGDDDMEKPTLQAVKISKEKIEDEEAARKLVEDAGYSVDRMEQDKEFFTFVQNEGKAGESVEIEDGIFAVQIADDQEKETEEKEADPLVAEFESSEVAFSQDAWDAAVAASMEAYGEINPAFVHWYYMREQAPAEEKQYIQKSPHDDNPYLELARQTNVLLGTLIHEVQEMSVKLDGIPQTKLEEIQEEQEEAEKPEDEFKRFSKAWKKYISDADEKFKAIGV